MSVLPAKSQSLSRNPFSANFYEAIFQIKKWAGLCRWSEPAELIFRALRAFFVFGNMISLATMTGRGHRALTLELSGYRQIGITEEDQNGYGKYNESFGKKRI